MLGYVMTKAYRRQRGLSMSIRIILAALIVLAVLVGELRAATIVTHADVTALTTCTQVLAASGVDGAGSPNRVCAVITNSSASTAARCGDASTSSSQGAYVAAGAGISLCVTSAITCCGVGASATINPQETVR